MKTHDEMIRDLYARREAYESQRRAKKQKIKRTALRLTSVAACLAICFTLGLGMHSETDAPSDASIPSAVVEHAPSDNETASEDDESLQTDTSKENVAVSVPPEKESPQWLKVAYGSYAVVEIVSIADETVIVDGTEYTKVNCNVMQTYRADAFDECDTMYLASNTAQQINAPETVFFELQELTVDGARCYTTATNETGAVCLSVRTENGTGQQSGIICDPTVFLDNINVGILQMYSYLQDADADVSVSTSVSYEDVIIFFEISRKAVAKYEE